MLTPKELSEVADTMHPVLDELNTWITNDMIGRLIKRFNKYGKYMLTGTDEWQSQVYKDAGGHYEALLQKMQEMSGKTEAEVKAIFEDIGLRAWNSDDAFYVGQGLESISLIGSERIMNILSDTYRRTNGEIKNFTRSTALASQQRYIKAMDAAHIRVMSGAQSYTAAVRDVVNELAEKQTTVKYPSGHVDTIETAVFRAIRTGTAQASGNMTLQGMIEHDWDLIRVSAHLGARYGDGGENPGNHFWWQGKLYSRTGRTPGYLLFEEATGYGTGEGLCGWNCRHSFGPGSPNFNPYKDYDAEENKKAYDLSQRQRKLERTIRADKLKVMGLREAVDNAENDKLKTMLSEDYEKASARLSMHNAEYNHLCESNGLKRLSERISIAKWNRSEAMKAVRAAQRYKKSSVNIAKSENSGIIAEESSQKKTKESSFAVDWSVVDTEEYDEAFDKLSSNPKVSKAIKTRAKWALSNRDLSQTEEIYAISLNSGEEIGRITTQHNISAVKRTKKFTDSLNLTDKKGEQIILIHNHPKGLPPSISDINVLLLNENVCGITVGHNGSVYYYTKPNNIITQDDWDVTMMHFKKYSEITAMEKSLEILSKAFEFEFIKIL